VAVNVRGLTVWFERSVGSVAANAISYPLDLGHATAVVAALDVNRHVDVKEGENGDVVVQTTAPPSNAQASGPGPSGPSSGGPAATQPRSGNDNRGSGTRGSTPSGGGSRPIPSTTPPGAVNPSTATPSAGDQAPATPADPGSTGDVTGDLPLPPNPDEAALPSPGEIADSLGLRGAHSVSRAFGAFLGLGLILPLARFVIRRLG
jgi:hypothetical protein